MKNIDGYVQMNLSPVDWSILTRNKGLSRLVSEEFVDHVFIHCHNYWCFQFVMQTSNVQRPSLHGLLGKPGIEVVYCDLDDIVMGYSSTFIEMITNACCYDT
uniref:Uncharacterized protein n=1 Tax=Salix viminalis TaxID=40686 RepID=A0A6N2K9U8_SALVM